MRHVTQELRLVSLGPESDASGPAAAYPLRPAARIGRPNLVGSGEHRGNKGGLTGAVGIGFIITVNHGSPSVHLHAIRGDFEFTKC